MTRSPGGLRPLVAAVGAALLAAPLPGPAADPPAVLRWPDVAAAAERHPLLVEARARVAEALGAADAAGELPGPSVSVSAGDATPRGGGATRREWGIQVDLPLEPLASRGPRVRSAEALADWAREEVRAARARVLGELRHAFVALAHAQAVAEAGAELEAQAARLAGLVRRRAEAGEGRPSEVPRAEVEHLRLQGSVERARAAVEARRARLAALTGSPVARVEADLAAAPRLPPLEELERGLGQHPAVRGARSRVTAAGEALDAAGRDRLPGLALGWSHDEELDRRASTVQATLTLPLWGWNGGRVRAAAAALDGERARLVGTSRQLHAGLAEAWQGCTSGQAVARRFRDEVLPRAEGSAATLSRAFELGEAGLLDVIDARRVRLDARREYLDLLLAMQDACADLAALSGLELP
jgi:cobalt-zinc-cadmium efflux system outer membrane protein